MTVTAPRMGALLTGLALVALLAGAPASAGTADDPTPVRAEAVAVGEAPSPDRAALRLTDADRQSLAVAHGVTVCLDVDVVVSLRLGISLGGHPPICRRQANPPAAPAPAPTPAPAPVPTPPAIPTVKPTPVPSATPSRRPAPSARPAVPGAPLAQPRRSTPRTAPKPVPPPVEHQPPPSADSPTSRARQLRAEGPLSRRRNPLSTVMVLIVLSLVIALVASVAFGAFR
jgi:hypothetical protein